MKKKKASNLAASVHHQLLSLAKKQEEDMSLVMKRYSIERFLFRLSKSRYSEQYILKGAMLFFLWKMRSYRPTKDLDLLGYGDGSQEILRGHFEEICAIEVEEDGLVFDPKSISIEEIREDQEYQGQRVLLKAKLAKAEIQLQIDIGFGDIVTPEAEIAEYPALLGFPAAIIRAYPRESVVAEKLQAAVALGMLNSRMKDLYDIWAMSQEFEFAGQILVRAIEATFKRRHTGIPSEPPIALTQEFSNEPQKVKLWKTFLERNRLSAGNRELRRVIEDLNGFLIPPLGAIKRGQDFIKTWPAGGPWEQ